VVEFATFVTNMIISLRFENEEKKIKNAKKKKDI